MPKNIVILCDGTGQIGGIGAATNVYKLFNMLEDRTPNQVVYYDPGIGSTRFGLPSQIFGYGFKRNILECYQFLFKNYESGDQIYLFGFSRGAATVRSLATFIELFGILPASRQDLIRQAFKIYTRRTDVEHEAHVAHDKKSVINAREQAAKDFVNKHHTMWTRVKFLGVWDTVAALGGTGRILSMITDKLFPHRFHNFSLGPGVDFARHAISIDDERKTFHPIIWEKLDDDPNHERLKQVWFCGVHTDVGGGYNEHELSYYSLDWMIRESEAKGLKFYKDSLAWKAYQELKKEASTNENKLIDGLMHNEQKSVIGKLYRREVRTWNEKRYGQIWLHSSVKRRTKNKDNGDDPAYHQSSWILKHENFRIEE